MTTTDSSPTTGSAAGAAPTAEAATTTAAAPSTAAAPASTDITCDIVVVGAGIAGLTAAERLREAGLDVRVVEARDRVGGRTEGGTFASGTAIELGGQWVGPGQDEVLALAKRLGLSTFTVYDEGASLLFAGGERTEGDDDTFGLGAESGQAFAALVELIDRTAATIDLGAPWESPDAVGLDRMTAAQWLDAHCADPGARAFMDTMLASILAAESEEYSALHMLFYLGSGGGLHRMMLTIGGAQESRVRGGTHQLSERLAERLGESVLLGEEVLRISGWDAAADSSETKHRGPGSVEVTTARRTLRCDRVIVAVPPAMGARMSFDPPLPALRDRAQSHMLPGDVIKFQVEYARPFWRDAGLSGTVLSLDHDVSLVYDNCIPDEDTGAVDRGILVAFVEGRHARAFHALDEDERARRVLEDLRVFFGEDAAAPTELLQRNWTEEPFTRGCYGGRFGTGLWTTVGAHLTAPSGRIHWAGAETAAVWNGYIDGAIRSGQRAAAEVVAE